METPARYIWVGVITLAIIIAGLCFTLWLSKADSQQDYKLYDVLFKEPVAGLTTGSPVHFNGIYVGEVTQLSLDANDMRIVRARIRIGAATPITQATKASRALLNITGASGISLEQSVAQSEPLKHTGDIPEIVAAPSELTQLRLSTEELFVNVSQMINNVNRLFSDNNLQSIESILTNVNQFSDGLLAQTDNIAGVLENLQAVTKQLNHSLSTLERQLTARTDPLFDQAELSLRHLAATSEQLHQVIEQNRGNIDAGLAGVAELGPTLLELQATLQRFNRIAARFETEHIKEYQP